MNHSRLSARIAAGLLIFLLAYGAWAQNTGRFDNAPQPKMVAEKQPSEADFDEGQVEDKVTLVSLDLEN